MPSLPSFPAPNLEGVIEAISEVFDDLVNAGTGTITNITQSVLDIWEMDCGGKWIVYVNTATVAATKALWLLLTPSLDEILENYLQPKPGRRHGRRGQRGDRARRAVAANAYRLFFRPPIPDIDEQIASLVPGSAALKGRRLAPGEWIFWTAIDVADAILWHWLLLEATETFTTTWQSELMQSGECQFANDATAKFTTPVQNGAGNDPMWGSVADLIGLHEENLHVVGNSEIFLEQSTFEGHALLLILGTWQATSADPLNQGVYEVGIRAKVYDRWNVLVMEKHLTTTITIGPNGAAAATLDFALITEDFHYVNLQWTESTIQSANLSAFTVQGDVSLGVRSIHVG